MKKKQNNTTNVIRFPAGSFALQSATKKNRVRVEVKKRLNEIFTKFIAPVVTIKLYSKYLKDSNEGGFDLAHIAFAFGQSIERDVEMYRECFLSLASNEPSFSVDDYRMLLSVVLSVDHHIIADSRLLQCCVDEIAIKLRNSHYCSDRLYKI